MWLFKGGPLVHLVLPMSSDHFHSLILFFTPSLSKSFRQPRVTLLPHMTQLMTLSDVLNGLPYP